MHKTARGRDPILLTCWWCFSSGGPCHPAVCAGAPPTPLACSGTPSAPSGPVRPDPSVETRTLPASARMPAASPAAPRSPAGTEQRSSRQMRFLITTTAIINVIIIICISSRAPFHHYHKFQEEKLNISIRLGITVCPMVPECKKDSSHINLWDAVSKER